jgi:redox-sensitive bicupin YhaK (pirin superfamily)
MLKLRNQVFPQFLFLFHSTEPMLRTELGPIPMNWLGVGKVGVWNVIERRPFVSLSGEERSWLKAKHHFLFDDSKDTWGALLMWNDDEVAPAGGFAPHSHVNMVIVTYVRRGAISHRDSLGNSGRTVAGDVQVMSAGTGIRHSEFNLEPEATKIFQIWIKPTVDGGSPAWGTKPFPKQDRAGRLVVLASGYGSDEDALPLRAEARVLGATLKPDQTVEYEVGERRYLYLVPAVGQVLVNGVRIDARDGAAIKDVRRLIITALDDSEFVLVDASKARSAPSSKAA